MFYYLTVMKLLYTHLILKTLQGRYSCFVNKKTDAESLGTQDLPKVAKLWLEHSLIISDTFIPGKLAVHQDHLECFLEIPGPHIDADKADLTQNSVVL